MNIIKFTIIASLFLGFNLIQNQAQEVEFVKVAGISRHWLRASLDQYLCTLDLMTGDRVHCEPFSTSRQEQLQRQTQVIGKCWILMAKTPITGIENIMEME